MASYGAAARDEGSNAFDNSRHLYVIRRPSDFYTRRLKPVIDRVGGALLLLLFSPLILASVLLVRLKVGTPVFYVQLRVGRDGELFELYKLRTMVPDRRKAQRAFKGPDRRRTHKSTSDPRVLPWGRLLRALRLDELPQFWNVVKGDMSLVGPRPEMPEIVEQYEEWQHQRHAVKPGVTGPWQISDQNGKLMHECTELDLQYLDSISLWHDLSIMARTPIAMLVRRGY